MQFHLFTNDMPASFTPLRVRLTFTLESEAELQALKMFGILDASIPAAAAKELERRAEIGVGLTARDEVVKAVKRICNEIHTAMVGVRRTK